MSRPNPPLLIVGPPTACQIAAQTLSEDGVFDADDLLTRFDWRDAPPLLRDRGDIRLVLLLWDKPDTADLPLALSAILDAGNGVPRCVLIRCRQALSRAEREALWEMGTADRLFSQPMDSRDLADSVATVLHLQARMDAVSAASETTARLERAATLWELAELILATITEQGIGNDSLFCLLGGMTHPRLMTVAGRGRYADVRCMPLDGISDAAAIAAVRQAMAERQSRFAVDSAVLYIETSADDVACVYLPREEMLSPWQQRLLGMLGNAFAIALGKNLAANRLQRTQRATISTMATLAEYRDVDTGEHVSRVARLVTEIAQVMADSGHLSDPELVGQIGLAAILHDVGKIAIPESILLKPGALTAAERETMETHTTLGRDILLRAAARSDTADLLKLAARIAHCHHEKFDGSGYPAGLKGEEIPQAARIVALVDVFDALANARPYKQPWPYEKVIGTIVGGAGTHFDPVVVDAFLALEGRRAAADFFVWDSTMSVGDPELDHDHKQLMAIINRLWVAEDGGNRQVIEFVLDDLVNYTESHFRREEQMMDCVGYPDVERHRGIHQSICDRLEDIRWEYHKEIREELRGEILEFLKDWLYKHILVEDMRYRPHLRTWSPTDSPYAKA